MSARSLKKTRKLLLAAATVLLTMFSLPPGQALADGRQQSISPEHARLIRLLRESHSGGTEYIRIRTAADSLDKDTAAPDQTVPAEPADTAPQRIYMDPAGEGRQLLLQALARRIGSMSASANGSDLQLLAEYNRLAGNGLDALVSAMPTQGITVGEPNTSEVEPNDTWDSAQLIAYGDVVAGSAIPGEDLDVYSFQGRQGEFVRLEALATSGNGFHVVMLFDAESNLVTGGHYRILEPATASEDSYFAPIIWPGSNVVGASLEKDGTYYAVVVTYPGGIIFLDASADSLYGGSSQSSVAYSLFLSRLESRPVTGKVSDNAGGPIEGAQLWFWSYDGLGGVSTVTGGDGTFSAELPEGEYSFSVTSPPSSRYPGDQIYDSFRVGTEGAHLELALKSGVIFSGATVDDRGNPVPGVGFSLVDQENRQYRWGSSDEEGAFSLAVFPGTFDIYVYPSYEYPSQPVIRDVEITQDTPYDIIIDSGKMVSGTVFDADSRPLAEVSLSFHGDREYRWARSAEDGGYRIAVTPGTWWVEVTAENARLIPHQFVGPIEVQEDTTWDIRLSAGGILSGSVADDRGNRVAGAKVIVSRLADYPDPTATDSVRTDEGVIYFIDNGDTTFTNPVDPGDSVGGAIYYRNYYYYYTDEQGAWQAALMPARYTVEVFPPYDYPQQSYPLGTFDIEEGGRTEVGQVQVKYGVLFSGRVLLSDGSPLAWETFVLASAENGGSELIEPLYYPAAIEPTGKTQVSTDENGNFSRRIFPGVYDLYFYGGRQNYPRQTVENLDLRQDRSLTINLESGYRVYGRVTDEAGEDLEGSYLSFYLDDGTWQGGVVSNPDGEYEITLVAGEYNLLVSPTKGYFPDSNSLNLKLEGEHRLDLVLRPGVNVHGIVKDKNGRGLPKVMVRLIGYGMDTAAKVAGPDGVPVQADMIRKLVFTSLDAGDSLVPAGADSVGGSSGGVVIPVAVDAAGNYLWLPAYGSREFIAWTDDSGYWEMIVKKGVYDLYASYAYGGYAGAFQQAVDCTQECRIELVLAEVNIIVEGVVEDEGGVPVPRTLVSLLNPATGDHVSTWTDESGRFEMNVPKGEYEVFVDGGEQADLVRSVASSLTVDRNRTLTIRLGSGIMNEDGGGPQLPRSFALQQNSPNPFNPSTMISYSISVPARVTLAVYDLRGRRIATLVNREQGEGDYTVQWDGRDSRGRLIASGIYFYRLEAGSRAATRKMVLLK